MQKEQKQRGLIWFQNNLRVHDHQALYDACKENEEVVGVYIFHPASYARHPLGFSKTGKFRFRFLRDTLEELRDSLSRLGIVLHIEVGQTEEVLPALMQRWNIRGIYTQKEWTAEERQITRSVLKRTDIPLHEYYDQFLLHPEDIPYKSPSDIPEVFTAFRKTCEKHWQVRGAVPLPEKRPVTWVPEHSLTTLPTPEDLGLEEVVYDARSAFPFSGGELQAKSRIEHYFWKSKKLGVYKRTRNGLCGPDYSSKLSPWLANGSLSARTVYREVKAFEKKEIKNQDTYWLIFELLWRDYFKYISLKHGDRIFYKSGIRQREYDWGNDASVFNTWATGKTGNDFVDANMLELSHTGWMSNRGRQNVASYWSKDLKQDWRTGAAWFESMLIDYDVHSNWGNWMYASGVGNDPRDRKFNTRMQADRYDPKGKFRKLWLQPELF